jgi:hypothetical protein
MKAKEEERSYGGGSSKINLKPMNISGVGGGMCQAAAKTQKISKKAQSAKLAAGESEISKIETTAMAA